jgi:DNA-binding NtrC family response regulator
MSHSPKSEPVPPPHAPQQRLLVVEDLEDTRTSLQQLLQLTLKLEVDVAEDGVVALEMLQQRPYSVVLADLRMPRLDGLTMIERINEKKIPVTVIVTTGHGGVPEAVKAMRMGAYDFLLKPADPQHLPLLVERALRERALLDEIATLRTQMLGKYAFGNVISKSPRMHDVFELVEQLSTTTTTVLINGETGSGKEQIARAIHNASANHGRKGPFMAVNCAAFNENLLESELFGHEKGAYTGATGQRKGRFEQAHGGTLFLDEVGDVPASMQVKLLRVLQERTFERVGGTQSIEVDVRVIAATHQPLEKLIKEGKFREDLYYRLNVMRIELPPLRDRPEDVPVLSAFFTEKYARAGQKLQISPEAMELLVSHPWPGNVRQLENAIERACVTCRDGVIRPENLPADVRHRSSHKKSAFQVDLSRPLPVQLSEMTANFEERYLRRALKRTRGHVGRCARISGLSRRSITDKIAQYKIDKEEFKK